MKTIFRSLAMVPIHKFNRSYRVWYLNRPLGKNMLGEFLSKCKHLVPPSTASRSKVANHSARKTNLSNLLHSDIKPLHVRTVDMGTAVMSPFNS